MASTATHPPRGRRPVQERAQRRREQLLDAALEELARHGAAELRMTEVAKRCGVPAASLYQYFPTRGALLVGLAARELAAHATGLGAIDAATPPAERWRSVEGALRAYVRAGLDPGVRELMYAMQADRELRALDVEDTRRNATHLAAVLPRPDGVTTADLVRRISLVIELAGALAVRLPDVAPRARAATVDDFVRMARALVGPVG